MRIIPSLLLGLSLTACNPDEGKSTDSGDVNDTSVDADGDGYTSDVDCDDSDASVHPDAQEVCDDLDNDCDGSVDEGVTQTWYTDADGDGHGDPSASVQACGQPDGAVEQGDDCDDTDATVYPDAAERCDGLDNDCDGTVDEDLQSEWYADADGDGYGDPASAIDDCDPAEGYVADDTDCDDSTAQVYPGADEVCDGLDNDCDGLLDDADDGVLDQQTWYTDADGDGYGDPATSSMACEQPSGTVADDTDCDDTDATSYPGADEFCDGADNDCDGDVDEADAVDASAWYADADGDGYGDPAASSMACEQPSGTVADDTDCDDTDATSYPGADEVCDGADNDCDGSADNNAIDMRTFYLDNDGDGFGDEATSYIGCTRPSGYAGVKKDCDDTDATINPYADEICDGLDNDCDELIDDDDDSLDTTTGTTFYADADADGFGDASSSAQACELPEGYVETDDDCDDTDSAVNPDAEDICNGIDDDCDGTTDPDAEDSDGDGITNCLDSTVYSEDFDAGTWGDWSYVDLGGGNTPAWEFRTKHLGERSNSANTIAFGPDLGQMWSYTMTVTAVSAGDYNNALGLAFGYEDSDNYWLLRWLDPNDFYGSYTPAGRVDLYRCVAGTCDVLATDDDSTAIIVAEGVAAELSVTVDGDDISGWIDGVEVVSYTATGEAPIGAFAGGVWSYDNDYTVYYDDFEVTNP